ncbi:hypothetical protein Tsubulata_002852 [Turnera subulata]|uniref:Uncharacterized protein n=1 Tax=Turnera subulata TaxID=218843 RepID=A0A9Q0J4Y8_9ROSI|nr:hypothetical protein Tsubulata_002852 [Turnera subulata]
MPPLFSTAYHQCRWNYRDVEDVENVDAKELRSHDMLKKGKLLVFQWCKSARVREKTDTLYFYITFTAKAEGEIDAFYCDTKVRRRGGVYKVLSFSRRTEEGTYQKDKPYVNLTKPESLSLINECASAAVRLYNFKMDAVMDSPRVMMAYHPLSLGENAYHIRFKARKTSSRPASICYATVIVDDEVEGTQKFVFPIERGQKTDGYVVESFIICPGSWQTGHAECQDKTAEMMTQISLEALKPAAVDVEDESPIEGNSLISVIGRGGLDSADE